MFILKSNGQTIKISGYTKEISSNKIVPFATIYEVKNKTGVISNSNGFYEIKCKSKDSLLFEVSHLNFKIESLKTKFSSDTVVTFYLTEKEIGLSEVSVIAKPKSKLEYSTSSSLDYKQIENFTALGGEKDVIKAFQFSPGVQQGSEGSIGLNVRGGSTDQNLFLFDNMTIYSPSHLFGFFSTFNSDIIQSAELVRAGLPANYGGKLSSLVDIKTKKPSFNNFNGTFSLGLISSKIYTEIPIIKGKSGLMLSVRRSYFDVLTYLNARNKNSSNRQDIGFYDINLKYEHTLNKNSTFSVNYMRNNDVFRYVFGDIVGYNNKKTDISGVDWSNQAFFLNYKYINNNSGIITFFAGMNQYDYNYMSKNLKGDTILSSYRKNSSIKDIIIKMEYEKSLTEKLRLSTGLTYTFHKIIPQKLYIMEHVFNESEQTANETNAFFQLNYNFSKTSIISFGLRQSIYKIDSTFFHPLEPRLNFINKFDKSLEFKSSISRNVQFLHRVEDYTTGLPTEKWYTSEKNLFFEDSYQFSCDLNKLLEKYAINVGTALYYKWMNNLVEYGSFYADFPMPKHINVSNIETNGKGQAFGLEFYLNKSVGRTTYSGSYLLSKSIRRFSNINENNWYPTNFDRRHYFNCSLNYKLSDKINFSLGWVFSSGQAITLPEGMYYPRNSSTDSWATLFYTGNRNNFRLPAYHRLDASVQFKKIRRHGVRVWEFDIYNVYNRSNPYCINFEPEIKYINNSFIQTGNVKIKQYSLFPIIPTVSYIWKFNKLL